MNIVHISTYDIGGAAIAALQLHNGLLHQGVNSDFLVLQKRNFYSGSRVREFRPIPKIPSLAKRVFAKLGFPPKKEWIEYDELIQMGCRLFSVPATPFDLASHSIVKNADIINLHWVAGFLDWNSFFTQTYRKPVVWTLHDMNPFRGGFHYSADAKEFEQFLWAEDKRIIDYKVKITDLLNNISVVAPSKWLKETSALSKVLGKFRHYHIPYGVDTSVFKLMEKQAIRRILEIPEEKPMLLFVSHDVSDRRKGFDLLTEALDKLEPNKEILLGVVGEKFASKSSNNIIYFGTVNDNKYLSLLYAAADVFILSSREDNLPNTMLESLACGTPVISFATGGMPDVIVTGFNGILVHEINSDGLRTAISDFLNSKYQFDRQSIAGDFSKKFNLAVQANAYIDLYTNLLAKRISL